MAIFKFAPDVEHISSKIGGMVFQSSALGNYMKVSPLFNQWRTVWQNKRKRYMLACVQHWKMLTEAQREAWRDWAALYPQPQLLNDTEFINGYNLFCKRNFYRYMVSDDTFTFMTDPVFDFYTETDTACEVLLGDGTLELKATFSAPNNKLQALFFVSPPQSQGRKFGDQRWRFVGSMLATNQTIDITDMYLSYFGILPAIDDHLFASVILCGIDQGQFTFHELQDITVEPATPPIDYGKYQIGAVNNGYLFRSEDYGLNWSQVGVSRFWTKVAISANGQYQTAASNTSSLFRSEDYGVTWSSVGLNKSWRGLAMSDSGQYQTACVATGYIYRSEDYGVTWSQVSNSQAWFGISVSSTGQYQTAIVSLGYIFRSTDYGVTWSQVASSRNWVNIAISGSGQYQTACVTNGYIYRSEDYGVTWSQVENSRNWKGNSMSSSGQYQTACVLNGYLYRSEDYGVTWSQVSSSRAWSCVSVSRNSNYQSATGSGSYVFRSEDYGLTWNQVGNSRAWVAIALN